MAYSLKATVKTIAGIGSADTSWDTEIDNTLIPMADREIDLELENAGAGVPLSPTPALVGDVSALLAAGGWWESRATALEPTEAGAAIGRRGYLRKRALDLLAKYIQLTYTDGLGARRADNPTSALYLQYPRDEDSEDGK